MPSLRYARPSGSVALIVRCVATTVFHGHPFTTTVLRLDPDPGEQPQHLPEPLP